MIYYISNILIVLEHLIEFICDRLFQICIGILNLVDKFLNFVDIVIFKIYFGKSNVAA